MTDLPEALSTGGIVVIVILALIALVAIAVVRFWWQLDHDEIEATAGGSYEDQFGGEDLPDDK